MRIQIDRLMADLKELGSIGFIPGQGASRMAYSPDFVRGTFYHVPERKSNATKGSSGNRMCILIS